jgi:hypothetical protein
MKKTKMLQIEIDYDTWKKLTIKKLEMDSKNWTEFLKKLAGKFK